MGAYTHDDRRLLNYRFQEVGAETYDAPATLMQRVNELAHSPTLPRSLHDARSVPVWSWNADYWYAYVERKDFVSYYLNPAHSESRKVIAMLE